MNYLREILTRDENELVKRVFSVQQTNPSPGDYVTIVENDFKRIGETMDTSVICGMTKEDYKKHIKNKLNEAALKELSEIQSAHSKVKYIKYSQLSI